MPALRVPVLSVLLLPLLSACGGLDGELAGASSSASTEASTSTSAGGGGAGGGSSSSGAGGGSLSAEAILNELRANTSGTLAKYAAEGGWPLAVDSGTLFVSTDLTLPLIAGDHDQWSGTKMNVESGFAWLVLPVPDGARYKFTDKTTFQADPWARSYLYDGFGEMSLVRPKTAHVDRWIGVGDAKLEPRTLRVWVPEGPIKHELYVQDGQNLFDPNGPWGGWHLQDTVPAAMLLVGIDNTPSRMSEYTHVPDIIGGSPTGGLGDAYADFLKNTVRPLIKARYGEPGPVGVMGSSLGGLISFHIADRDPDQYAFAASLSGTMGWGSIGPSVHNPTMIERYKSHGHRSTVLYLDSGGDGVCFDSDNDGIKDDDQDAGDNYCENAQLRDVLYAAGYKSEMDFYYWWEKDASHNEAEWAARVFRPLAIFNAL